MAPSPDAPRLQPSPAKLDALTFDVPAEAAIPPVEEIGPPTQGGGGRPQGSRGYAALRDDPLGVKKALAIVEYVNASVLLPDATTSFCAAGLK